MDNSLESFLSQKCIKVKAIYNILQSRLTAFHFMEIIRTKAVMELQQWQQLCINTSRKGITHLNTEFLLLMPAAQ